MLIINNEHKEQKPRPESTKTELSEYEARLKRELLQDEIKLKRVNDYDE